MRRFRIWIAGTILVLGGSSLSIGAQDFHAGSNGSAGALLVPDGVTTNIVLPADGVLHHTSVNIGADSTVTFERNGLNTPVYLLATTDIVVQAGALIDVGGEPGTIGKAGRGGPGGFDGGRPGYLEAPSGDGHGPGAGGGSPYGVQSGNGAYGSWDWVYGDPGPLGGASYGSPLLVPLVGGSGSGAVGGSGVNPGNGGAGGGGAILFGSDTQVEILGSIHAQGAVGGGGAASSGGAIRLVAPLVHGWGRLNVNGGHIGTSQGYGGPGRIRIDSLDPLVARSLKPAPAEALSVGSYLAVFPDNLPRLDLVEVASVPIAAGTPADLRLAFGSDSNQTVVVQATHFDGTVPIRVVLIPDNGPAISYDTAIDMAGGDVASVTVPVVFPINVSTAVSAWTR